MTADMAVIPHQDWFLQNLSYIQTEIEYAHLASFNFQLARIKAERALRGPAP